MEFDERVREGGGTISAGNIYPCTWNNAGTEGHAGPHLQRRGRRKLDIRIRYLGRDSKTLCVVLRPYDGLKLRQWT